MIPSLDGWEQIGIVEILRSRVYPLDPSNESPSRTTVFVEPGIYPVYQKDDAVRWLMTGKKNKRVDGKSERIGDDMYMMHPAHDNPYGADIPYASPSFSIDQLKEFMAEPMCQPGDEQRLRFDITLAEKR